MAIIKTFAHFQSLSRCVGLGISADEQKTKQANLIKILTCSAELTDASRHLQARLASFLVL